MQIKASVIALGLTSTIALYGCGDDSTSTGSSASSDSTTYSVKAIDGYLRGAQVWLDLNNNFVLDSGEPSATSGGGGVANIDTTGIDNPEGYPLVVKSTAGETIDEDTGHTVAKDFVLSAPAGVPQITPLTTLVHVKVLASGGTLDVESAIAEVADDLGIDADTILSDFVESGSSVAAFAAKSIVSSGIIPETTDELSEAANDDDGDNSLLTAVATLAAVVKTVIENTSDTSTLSTVYINSSLEEDSDSDGDGVANSDDAFVDDDSEWLDTDNDGTGNNADTDDDDDGVLDTNDAFPLDSTESVDTDNDGIGNNTDDDDDGDGVADESDAFPLDAAETLDTDNDGTGNNADTDDDGDGVADTEDAFPLDEEETIDTDGDGTGNNADTDDDNDGVSDSEDAFPLDAAETLDTDGDGTGNNADADDDNDGIPDTLDVFPLDANEYIDTDGDGTGNNSDTDDDGDGVADDSDAFPLDSTETTDTDGDGVGDNTDAFPNDATETIDSDGDGVGDNSDVFPTDSSESADSDGDGVGDNADDFPTDATETTDSDGDGVGDNSDAFPNDSTESVDGDGDGVGDNSDAFPEDATETLDTDGDGIGNNTDDDDDGDGVLDTEDVDPLDPNIGSQSTIDIIEYLGNQSVVYSPWIDEDDDDHTRIYIDTMEINGTTATMTALSMVKAYKGEVTLDASSESDIILTETGWATEPTYWEIDFTDGALSAYPSGYSEISYTLSGSLSSLAGTTVANSGFEWEDYSDTTSVFPSGSYMIDMSLTPDQDIYYLWDWQPYILDEANDLSREGATSLSELIFTNDTNLNSTSSLQGFSLGEDIFVKLIDGGDGYSGTAQYYSVDWDSDEITVNETTSDWVISTINSEEVLEFTVPDEVAAQWGDEFDEETNDIIISTYNGVVYIGVKESSGETLEDDGVVLLNQTAKDALIDAVEIPVYKCYTGDNDGDSTVTTDDFATAVADCYGATAITSEMVSGNNFHRIRSSGGTRDYTFNSDGTMDVYKSGEYGYTGNWEIDSDGYVKITFDDSDDVWYWALLDYSDTEWSLKFYESYEDDEETITEIWSSIVTLQDLNVCSISDATNQSLSDYQVAIEAYEDCTGYLPSISGSDLLGAHWFRAKSNGETRAYLFDEGGEASYYRDGIVRERDWDVSEDGIIEIYGDGDSSPYKYFTLLKDVTDNTYSVAVYDADDDEIWTSQYVDVSGDDPITDCTTGNNEWDDENDQPETFTSYSDFTSSLETCLEESELDARFSEALMEQLPRKMMASSESDSESYVFYDDGTGDYSYTDTETGETEDHEFTWSLNDDNAEGELIVVIEAETTVDGETVQITYTDHMYITDTDGVDFALKIWSYNSLWESEQGDAWSNVFTFAEAD